MTDFDDLRVVYLLSVWLHVLAAIVWIGGMVFLGAVLVPELRRPSMKRAAPSLLYRTALRFRWLGWAALLLLLVTGTFNLGYRGYAWSDLWSGGLWEGGFGRALGFKLLLVAAIVLISAVHDFVLGPRTARRMQDAPDAAATKRLRRQASWMGRITLVLSLIVLWLAVLLLRGGL